MKKYIVGGYVRDLILGQPSVDRDWVVVGETHDSMMERGFKSVGLDFCVYIDQHNEEHALARQERSTGRKYTDFEIVTENVSLEDDLFRRDLTINSIAMDEEGNFIDPYGGIQDISDRIIRHTSIAFCDDPVRILRTCRFAARYHSLGFTVHPKTLSLMKDMVQHGDIDHLTKERVWREIEKVFQNKNGRVFFELMREIGALVILMPEVDRLWGIPQPEAHHPEIDTGVHTMMVLDMVEHLSSSPETRFAALVHDLGKGTTPPYLLPKHHGHEERSGTLIKDMCSYMLIPNSFRDIAILVGVEHINIHKANELRPGTIVEVLQRLNAWRDPIRFNEILLACEADARGRLGLTNKQYPQYDFWNMCLNMTKHIDARKFIERGLTGKEIGNAIFLERAERVAEYKRYLKNV